MFVPFKIKDLELVKRLFFSHLKTKPALKFYAVRPSAVCIKEIEKAFIPFFSFKISTQTSIKANVDGEPITHLIQKTRNNEYLAPASFSFSESAFSVLREGNYLNFAEEDKIQDATVYPHDIRPSFAYSEELELKVRREEQKRVYAYMKTKYPGKKITDLDYQTRFLEISNEVLYLPAYIIRYTVNNFKFESLINGYDGKTFSVKHLNHDKLALTISAPCLVVHPLLTNEISLNAILLTGLLYFGLKYTSFLLNDVRQAISLESQKILKENKDCTSIENRNFSFLSFFKDPTKVYENFEEWQNKKAAEEASRHWREYQEYLASIGHVENNGIKHPDLKGYYSLLGLSGTESQNDVSKAFKRLATMYHPDNKDTGNPELFKKISEAHVVLKNDVSRKRYDDGVNF